MTVIPAVCPRCHGRCFIERQFRDGAGKRIRQTDPCSDCEGAGTLAAWTAVTARSLPPYARTEHCGAPLIDTTAQQLRDLRVEHARQSRQLCAARRAIERYEFACAMLLAAFVLAALAAFAWWRAAVAYGA